MTRAEWEALASPGDPCRYLDEAARDMLNSRTKATHNVLGSVYECRDRAYFRGKGLDPRGDRWDNRRRVGA